MNEEERRLLEKAQLLVDEGKFETVEDVAEARMREGDILARITAIAERYNPLPNETLRDVMLRAIDAGDQDAIDLVMSLDLDARR